MLTGMGKVVRFGLILKNADGKYDRVAMYADKTKDEPSGSWEVPDNQIVVRQIDQKGNLLRITDRTYAFHYTKF